QRGPESPATIQNDLSVRVRNTLLDVALDDAFAQMNGAGKMPLRPLVVLANVHEDEFFTRVGTALHVGHVGFLDLFLCFVDQLEELRRMRHFNLPPANSICSENNTGSGAPRVPGSIRSSFNLFRLRTQKTARTIQLCGLSVFGLSAASFLANERTRFTKFQRTLSFVRSPSPGIFPLPLLMIQKSSDRKSVV